MPPVGRHHRRAKQPARNARRRVPRVATVALLVSLLAVALADAAQSARAATPCDHCTVVGRACNATTQTCIPCTASRGCTDKQRCDVSTGTCQVKGFFSPFIWSDGVLVVLVFLAAGVSNAGGVGGGILYVPMLSLVGGFTLNDASANSQALIFAASLANAYFNLRKRHVTRDAPRIDWNLVVSTVPFFLAGTTLGAFLNSAFPAYFTALVLAMMLGLLAVQSSLTGTRMARRQLRKRRQAAEQAARARDRETTAERAHCGNDDGHGGDVGDSGNKIDYGNGRGTGASATVVSLGKRVFADHVPSESTRNSAQRGHDERWPSNAADADTHRNDANDAAADADSAPSPEWRRERSTPLRRSNGVAPGAAHGSSVVDGIGRGADTARVSDTTAAAAAVGANDPRASSSSAVGSVSAGAARADDSALNVGYDTADDGGDGGDDDANVGEDADRVVSYGGTSTRRRSRSRSRSRRSASASRRPTHGSAHRWWVRVDPQLHAKSLEHMLALERPWFQWRYMLVLFVCWLIVFLIRLFSGSRDARPPGGLPLCGVAFWLLFALQESLLLAVGCVTVLRNVRLHALRERLHYPWYAQDGMGDMQWSGRIVYWYPAWSLIVGTAGAWLGLGGSSLLIPVLHLVARVDPVPVQSSMSIVNLTGSAAASIVYLVSGRLNISYALFLGLFSLLGSYSGVMLVYFLVERFQLKALFVLSLAVAFSVAVGIMLYIGIRDIVAVVAAGVGWQFTNLCEPATQGGVS